MTTLSDIDCAHGDDLMSRPTRMKKMLSLIVLTVSAIKAQRAAA
jgi:hypothetical protein